MAKITDRLIHAWNAFNGRDPTRGYFDIGSGSSYNPQRSFYTFSGNDRSIVNAVINRIAVDTASVSIRHARLGESGNFDSVIPSMLNNCLTLDANLDQTGRSFIEDAVTSMCDEGVVALVPTDIDTEIRIPKDARAYEIEKLRTGQILEWFPKHVRVRVYNELTGQKEEIIVRKAMTAIVENPFYDVMNRPNSTLQRLIRTLNNMDILDEQNSSGKLDLIIQLPYVVKNDVRRQQAEERRSAIEKQLIGSKYGIAYTDGTEKITQLNRPVENNLWSQAKELQDMLFSQLGLTPSIFDGTADEATMLNYRNRTIEPILSAFTDEMNRKFLTQTARTQGQAIIFFNEPFKLTPASQIAEIADKFTRNEILSPNEIRAVIGYKPSGDPKSDELRNRNINEGTIEKVKDQKIQNDEDSEETT